jgi:hypothetical protein
VCYYTCEGPNHAALLSIVQLDVSLFRPFFFGKTYGLYYCVYPGSSDTVRGSNRWCVATFITLFYPLSLCDKKGE